MVTFHAKWRRSLQASTREQLRAFYKLSVSLKVDQKITIWRWNSICIMLFWYHVEYIKRTKDFSHEMRMVCHPTWTKTFHRAESFLCLCAFWCSCRNFFQRIVTFKVFFSFSKRCTTEFSFQVKFICFDVKLEINVLSDKSFRINIEKSFRWNSNR